MGPQLRPREPANVSPGSGLTRATLLLIGLAILGRAVGFLREVWIAHLFGAGADTDAFLIGTFTAVLVYQIVTGRALTTCLLPVFASCVERGDERKGCKVVASVSNLFAFALLVASILGLIFAEPLVRVVAPGISDSTACTASTVARILFPTIVPVGIAAALTAVLHYRRRFVVPAVDPIVRNLFVILGAAFLCSAIGILGLAVGLAAGACISFIIYVAAYRSVGGRYHFTCSLRDQGVRQVLRRCWPFLLAAGMTGAVGPDMAERWFTRIVASTLPEGAIAALTYADCLVLLPVGILAASLSTALFPSFAQAHARRDGERLGHLVSSSLRLLGTLLLPLSAFYLAFGKVMIEIVYLHGAFDSAALQRTHLALVFLSASIFLRGSILLLLRVFHSAGVTLGPVLIYLVSLGTGFGAMWILRSWLAEGGIALGVCLAGAICLAGLLAAYRPLTGASPPKGVVLAWIRIGAAAAVAIVAAWLLSRLFPLPSPRILLLVWLAAFFFVSLLFYAIALRLLAPQEYRELRQRGGRLISRVIP